MTRAEPRSRSTDQRYYGVVPAIVQEVEGDDEGRVKLSFPWFADGPVTDWCRVSQLYAGNGYGSCFVPEVGDEVLVAFIHGDMRLPIVLGGLYNGQDKPPTDRREGRDRKMIRTRHGHQLIFDDQPGQAAVQVVSAAGHRVELDDEGKKISVTTADGGSVSIRSAGAVTIHSDDSVVIDAPRIVLDSADVELGGAGATEPVVLGRQLATQYNTHTHGTGSGPTTPPAAPLTALSTAVKTT